MSTYRKSFATVFALALLAGAAATSPAAQTRKPPKTPAPSAPPAMPIQRQPDPATQGQQPPSGANFYIEPIRGQKIQYSVLLTDNANRSVPGTFMRGQIDIFEALLLSGKEFALNEEEVGTPGQPKVTRFMHKQDKSFIIDVQKAGEVSHFYVTIDSLTGRLTIDAGIIRRGKRKEGEAEPEPLFYKIITRVQTAKASTPVTQETQQ